MIDRKSQHVGNHGGAYRDNDGMSKQFTYIDHDIKSKLSSYKGEDINDINAKLTDHRIQLIERLLEIPAVFANDIHKDFTVVEESTIQWNVQMIKDEGVDINKLGDIYRLASNKQEFHKKGITI